MTGRNPGLPPDRSGVAGAVTSTFRQVGNALGVALLGSLAFTAAGGASAADIASPGFVDGLHTAYTCAAIVAAVCAVVGLVAFRGAGAAGARDG